MANKKYIIEFSHPMREMLAEVFLYLENFNISEKSKNMVVINRKTSHSPTKSSFKSSIKCEISRIVNRVQKKIGLINFRVHVGQANCDIVCAHGGFLITNRPYVTYIEKATQLYGYTAKNYDKPLSIFLVRYFLKDTKLKKMIFLSEAALEGMINIESFDDDVRTLIREKSIVVYPPISRPKAPDVARFRYVHDDVSFLYVSNNFYGKGGLEVFHAFSKLKKEYPNIRLVIITDLDSIDISDYPVLSECDGVEMHDFTFTRDELFDKFFDCCHVLVYPTYSDSFSSVVNEALSSYMPVITTNFYAIPERVISGYNGFVCESPFRNYDEHSVITSEHFTDQPKFFDKIHAYQKDGRLMYVEDFLFDKMYQFIADRDLLYTMAKNCQKFATESLDSVKIRARVDSVLRESLQV